MSKGSDWTREFRACPTVDEYLLIGETDHGVSGIPWDTWSVGRPGSASTYMTEGWVRVDLDALSVLQIARTDTPLVCLTPPTCGQYVSERRGAPEPISSQVLIGANLLPSASDLGQTSGLLEYQPRPPGHQHASILVPDKGVDWLLELAGSRLGALKSRLISAPGTSS
ncbi:hypothetical protein BDK51DRAFT_52216 [Blyttiomyces helicus]|uniref:Uncharacterized protein n=1 Tax=Blyttiomyces helicus TaxID=388810 RepID=A0A4P9WD25_9FUNG|nr:hypothetical protein BDK51DRAFT_52216 [Blyttiomyces helicus]|eukprot:RKO88830.1 hypothetical protein BDK51DRAFT_52216 [Blyttiomyces helicus]